MTPFYIALTTLTDRITPDELAAVAAALQTQIIRDFAPHWGVTAVVAAVCFEAMPAGYIPVIVQDTLDAEGANGFHRTRADDTPYIVIPYGSNWSLAASHEVLRMLANPTGSARRPGPSCMPGQGTVEYLLDICAPCQDITAAYAIDGVTVSDFCTPAFFNASRQTCSFTAAVRQPFEPAANAVATWLADDALLYQARSDHLGCIRVHGGFSPANRGKLLLRELADALTPDRLPRLANAPRTARLLEAEQNARRVRLANMNRFREDIAWRFGHASLNADEPITGRAIRRSKTFANERSRAGRPRVDQTAENALRNAS